MCGLFFYRFRKIPGDKCTGGFTPQTKVIDLNKECDEFGQAIVRKDEGKNINPAASSQVTISLSHVAI